MTEAEIRAVAEPILQRWLGPCGLTALEIQPGEDFEGDPIIELTARYPAIRPTGLAADRLLAKASIEAVHELREMLISLGETRFPMLIHKTHQ